MSDRHRPTPAELAAAQGKRVADVIGPGLDVLFCGINPGLWSAAVGHHFAHPGNRFWKALHASGFTETLLSPAFSRMRRPRPSWASTGTAWPASGSST